MDPEDLNFLNSTSFEYFDTNLTVISERPPHWVVVLDTMSTVIMTVNTITLMLGMGAAIWLKEIWAHTKRPIGAGIGMVGQFVVLPAIGFGLSRSFGFRPYEAMSVLILSCSPGGSFSNFFTYWADGDLALSVMMTTVSSIIAFGGMPLNLWIYSHHWLGDEEEEIVMPFLTIVTSLFFVMGPVIVGMIIRHFNEKIATMITRIASMIGWLGFLLSSIIWIILYHDVFRTASPTLYAGATLLPISGFVLAYACAKIFCQSHKICRTIGIETGSQNCPVAMSVMLLSFPDMRIKSRMLVFPTLYVVMMLIQVIIGLSVFQFYKKKCGTDDDDDLPVAYTAKIEHGTPAEKAVFTA